MQSAETLSPWLPWKHYSARAVCCGSGALVTASDWLFVMTEACSTGVCAVHSGCSPGAGEEAGLVSGEAVGLGTANPRMPRGEAGLRATALPGGGGASFGSVSQNITRGGGGVGAGRSPWRLLFFNGSTTAFYLSPAEGRGGSYLGIKMSESSSDSESSCGWTIINHEGSDVEILSSDKGEAEGISQPSPDQQLDKPFELQAEETEHPELPMETLTTSVTLAEKELFSEPAKGKMADDSTFVGATSDDSDIVTLEPPPVEDLQAVQEETEVAAQEQTNYDELNLGSSSSSQYTFAPPETVSTIEESRDESSSDETSGKSSPTLRRRRIRKKTMSSSETEEKPDEDVVDGEQQQQQHRFNTTLNKCILLALVIAFSMGFGHFYGEFEGDIQDGSQLPLKRGTTQIQEQQKIVKKIHEEELNDVKDDLFQCQKDQAGTEELLEDIKEKPDMLLTLTKLMDKMKKENEQLKEKQAELQVVCFQRNSSPGHHQQFQLWNQKKDLGTERESNTTMKPQEWKRKHGRGDPQYLDGGLLAKGKFLRKRDNKGRLEFWHPELWEINLGQSQFHKNRKQIHKVHQKISRRKVTSFPKKERTNNTCHNKKKRVQSVHQCFQRTHSTPQKSRKGPSKFARKGRACSKYAIKSGKGLQNKLSKKSLHKNGKDRKVFQKSPTKNTHNTNQRAYNTQSKLHKKSCTIYHKKRKQPNSKKNPCLPKDTRKTADRAYHKQICNQVHCEMQNKASSIQTKVGKSQQHSKRKQPITFKEAHVFPKKPRKEPTMSAKKKGKGSQYLAKQVERNLQYSKKKRATSIIKSSHNQMKKSQKRANNVKLKTSRNKPTNFARQPAKSRTKTKLK
ncbi:cell cycle progression protein 1 isoform X8 [Chiloscyllium plagiosum]|uniref:cell cycle progression protein 1 isoform X8 n=1 Tax=Chiloscyllium plagiosum TaxID=36176 RepID=UPI001CB7C566|nr:cell cycle progression protein 1 isoform X8 [Chiloscyllium plagiosum]